MITQDQANAITEYKLRERLTRRKFLNALIILLEAQSDQSTLELATQSGGELELAREFYESQLARISAFLAPASAIISQFHQLMAAAQAADPSLFFGEVPSVGQ